MTSYDAKNLDAFARSIVNFCDAQNRDFTTLRDFEQIVAEVQREHERGRRGTISHDEKS